MMTGSNFKSCASAIPPPGRILRFIAYLAVFCHSAISSCTSSCTSNHLFWSYVPGKQSGPTTVKQQARQDSASRGRLSFAAVAASTLFRPATHVHARQLLADRAFAVFSAGKDFDLHCTLAPMTQLQPHHIATVRTVDYWLMGRTAWRLLPLCFRSCFANRGPPALLFGCHSAPFREFKKKGG